MKPHPYYACLAEQVGRTDIDVEKMAPSRALVVTEKIPFTLIVPTAELIERMREQLKPIELTSGDEREIVNQIFDVMNNHEPGSEMANGLRHLPILQDRIGSASKFSREEEVHHFKAVVFEMAWDIYQHLQMIGAFECSQYPGRFPYIFGHMVGLDAQLFHFNI